MHTATFDVHPVSKNVSINQAAHFNCSPSESDPLAVVWKFCSESAQNANGDCENIQLLSAEGSQSIIDTEINIALTPELHQLTVLIRDDLNLLNKLNNSLIYCEALYIGIAPVISSQARLLFQGQLYNYNYASPLLYHVPKKLKNNYITCNMNSCQKFWYSKVHYFIRRSTRTTKTCCGYVQRSRYHGNKLVSSVHAVRNQYFSVYY